MLAELAIHQYFEVIGYVNCLQYTSCQKDQPTSFEEAISGMARSDFRTPANQTCDLCTAMVRLDSSS